MTSPSSTTVWNTTMAFPWMNIYILSSIGDVSIPFRLVHTTWAREVDRICDRFAVIRLNHWDVFDVVDHFTGARGKRLRRLLLTSNISLSSLSHLNTVVSILSLSPNLDQLRMHFNIKQGRYHEEMQTILKVAMEHYLPTSSLRLLRWTCPPLDILACANNSHVQRLILDEVPFYSQIGDSLPSVITLHYLSSLQVTLCGRFPSYKTSFQCFPVSHQCRHATINLFNCCKCCRFSSRPGFSHAVPFCTTLPCYRRTYSQNRHLNDPHSNNAKPAFHHFAAYKQLGSSSAPSTKSLSN